MNLGPAFFTKVRPKKEWRAKFPRQPVSNFQSVVVESSINLQTLYFDNRKNRINESNL
jgi:hypothetical protein